MSKSAQKGIIDPKIIIGAVVVGVIVFFVATGNFKFSGLVGNKQPSSTSESSPAPQSKPKTYQNEKYGISLEYPSSWNIRENPSEQHFVGFFSPQEESGDKYYEYLAIKAVDVSSKPDITLTEVADLWESQTVAASKKEAFAVTDRKSSTVAGEDAKDIIYTGKVDEIDLKGFARIVLKDGKVYIFQYYAETKSYDKYLPDIEEIMSTVKI